MDCERITEHTANSLLNFRLFFVPFKSEMKFFNALLTTEVTKMITAVNFRRVLIGA